jgi:2-oxoglutarate ferredoxin oxidoreductase subunit delta
MGSVRIVSENCKGCGYCVVVCPKNVLEIDDDSNKMGYRYAKVARPDECIACKLCAIMCPDSAIEVFKEEGKR